MGKSGTTRRRPGKWAVLLGGALLVARTGRDRPALNASLDRLVGTALAANAPAPATAMDHPTGRHAFNVLGDDPRSHEIIRTTADFLRTHLDTPLAA